MSEMIPFIDLAAQQARIKPRLDAAIQRVLAHGGYIMGPEVRQLEEGLEVFSGAGHCISCANGTDALQMALMALQVGAGDAIITPTFTFAATAEVVALVNATPIMVDVLEETFNIDPASIGPAVGAARDAGLRPVGVIAVDLFGQPADYDLLEAVCAEHDLWLLCDSAQGFGAVYKGRRTGTIGKVTTTSFFPAKPLGCYGDGGAIFTDDDDLAQRLRSIRMHGKGSDKYDNVRIGLNGRLDTLQAAILLEKLEIYADEIEARQRVAARYETALSNLVATPRVLEGRPASGRSTPSGSAAATGIRFKRRCIQPVFRMPSTIPGRCTSRRLIADSPPSARPLRSANGSGPMWSRCLCTPIWTRQPRSASSKQSGTPWPSEQRGADFCRENGMLIRAMRASRMSPG